MAKEDKFGMVALQGLLEKQIELDPRYKYKVTHTGTDASGAIDIQSVYPVWISTSSYAVSLDKSVEDEKYMLNAGKNETFGPGISTLYAFSVVNADGVLKIIRIGTPTNSY